MTNTQQKHVLRLPGRIFEVLVDDLPEKIDIYMAITFIGNMAPGDNWKFIQWLDEIVMDVFDSADPRPVLCNVPVEHLEEMGVGYLFK